MKTIKIATIALFGTLVFASCSEEEKQPVSSPSTNSSASSNDASEDDGDNFKINIQRDEDGGVSGGVEAEMDD